MTTEARHKENMKQIAENSEKSEEDQVNAVRAMLEKYAPKPPKAEKPIEKPVAEDASPAPASKASNKKPTDDTSSSKTAKTTKKTKTEKSEAVLVAASDARNAEWYNYTTKTDVKTLTENGYRPISVTLFHEIPVPFSKDLSHDFTCSVGSIKMRTEPWNLQVYRTTSDSGLNLYLATHHQVMMLLHPKENPSLRTREETNIPWTVPNCVVVNKDPKISFIGIDIFQLYIWLSHSPVKKLCGGVYMAKFINRITDSIYAFLETVSAFKTTRSKDSEFPRGLHWEHYSHALKAKKEQEIKNKTESDSASSTSVAASTAAAASPAPPVSVAAPPKEVLPVEVKPQAAKKQKTEDKAVTTAIANGNLAAVRPESPPKPKQKGKRKIESDNEEEETKKSVLPDKPAVPSPEVPVSANDSQATVDEEEVVCTGSKLDVKPSAAQVVMTVSSPVFAALASSSSSSAAAVPAPTSTPNPPIQEDEVDMDALLG